MPIFEFRCRDCQEKFSTLVGMTADSDDLVCPICGSKLVEKLVSRVAKYRNEDQRIAELGDRLELMGEPESPSEMRSMVREMGAALDEGATDEMEEMFESDLQESDLQESD